MVLYSTVGCSVLFAKTSDFVIATWSNVTVALLLNAGIQCHVKHTFKIKITHRIKNSF